jgi:hypothetical protein
MFPAAIPPIILARKIRGSEVANPNNRYAEDEISKVITMIDLRPLRSDRRPSMGDEMKIASENNVTSNPI